MAITANYIIHQFISFLKLSTGGYDYCCRLCYMILFIMIETIYWWTAVSTDYDSFWHFRNCLLGNGYYTGQYYHDFDNL